ncbi:MAG: hypothetical protein EDX89_10280 [Acidobacteria bacterium]|nr:MAG: hypothetical protein EDX89_10280 [Acidobacteriota bacterium]
MVRALPVSFAALLLAVPAAAAPAPAPIPPEKASKILSARNLGLAQLEEGKNRDARRSFERLAELVPDDPLPYANAAVAALRDNDFAAADTLLGKATKAGGERSDLLAIRAAIEDARNRPEEARAALARAAAVNPRDLESRWRFVRSVEALPQPAPALKEARRKALAEIVAVSPSNLPSRLKLLLHDLEAGSAAEAGANLAEVASILADADAKTKRFLGESQEAFRKGDFKTAGLKARVLENLLRVTPQYQQSLAELFTNVVGLPLDTLKPEVEASLRPRSSAAIPVSFRASGGKAEDPGVTLRRVDLSGTGKAEVYAVPAPHGAATFLDHDLDGDLDVYLASGPGPDKLLRNNMDGTFTDVTAGTGDPAFRSTGCVVSDFDRDGDLDLACVEASGKVVLRSNQRQGRFRSLPVDAQRAAALDAADLDADGVPDLAVATKDGAAVLRGTGDGGFARLPPGDLAKLPAAFDPRAVVLADLDNDGFPDLVVSGASATAAFRNTGGAFAEWATLPKGTGPAERMAALDADSDGDLDLVLSSGGKPVLLTNDGGNANGWLVVVLEGLQTGSGKVNRAGLGSTVEVKAGDLYVARTVGVLPTHFGLGPRTKADVVRTLFTNGVPQNSLDQRARTVVKEVQILKGSCPFVYALNGATGEWGFVSDALGRAPIGLLYDGVHLAGADTLEWLHVDGGLLQPTPDGRLLLDYTEELWEVAYLDEATLVAVDHPDGTLVVPNERMTTEPLERKLFTVAFPRPPRAATSDASGREADVLARLLYRDKRYVDPGPETRYQGVRNEHALVLDLGPVRRTDRVVLFLDGWIFYTDTSINVSISQRKDLAHFPPVLEVPDGKGGWRTAIASLGFPAGKTKTMPVDLTGLLDPSDPRVRIRTTMAIFWDQAFVTVNDPPVPVVSTLLPPERATLTVRGFSRRYRETPDGPELFDHDDVTPGPLWPDVPGRLTRLGDVTELLRATDDRYVAFQGGDAIRIEYDATALPPLPPGFRRDWVLVSDGWDKDFDKNTVTGESVEPWPFHGMSAYPPPEGERHPDPAFLQEWMTRPTGPEAFWKAVRDHRLGAGGGR